MPRRLLAATISAGVLTLGLSPALSAPTKRPEKSRFYEFSGGLAFEVTRKIPTLDLFRLKLDPNFGRMLSLKKDLVPGIFTARSAPVFK